MVGEGQVKLVLVGTSLGEDSDDVLRAGLDLARAAGAKVHAAHAFALPVEFAGGPLGAGWLGVEVVESQQASMAEALAAQIERLAVPAELLAGTTVDIGTPHQIIADTARATDADIVVVGATDERGPFARFLGSTAERVIRTSPRPVLVVRGPLGVPPGRVLAPVDLSELSAEAFACGVALLERMGAGATTRVTALFALSPVQRQIGAQFTPDQVDRFVTGELERLVGGAGSTALDTATQVRVGKPRNEILAAAREWPADLVMIGTHGRGGFQRFVIGSVAIDVAHQAPCSVLVIPPAAAHAAALAPTP